MKRLVTSGIVLVCFSFLCGSAVGCEQPRSHEEKIVGKWQPKDPSKKDVIIEFRKDKTGTWTDKDGTTHFTYSIKGDTLTIRVVYWFIPYTREFTILTLNDTDLKVRDESDKTVHDLRRIT